MATFQTFEDIEAWQRARELVREIYTMTNQGSFAGDFVLRSQIRRAAISVLSNIAEGYERSGTHEFMQYLAVAKGSAGEVRAQLYVAQDQRYISPQGFKRVFSLASRTSQLIGGLILYLREAGIKGTKYK